MSVCFRYPSQDFSQFLVEGKFLGKNILSDKLSKAASLQFACRPSQLSEGDGDPHCNECFLALLCILPLSVFLYYQWGRICKAREVLPTITGHSGWSLFTSCLPPLISRASYESLNHKLLNSALFMIIWDFPGRE